MSKITQSGGLLCKILGNLGKKALLELAAPFAKNGLPKLATKATLSILDKLERKISGEKKQGKDSLYSFQRNI